MSAAAVPLREVQVETLATDEEATQWVDANVQDRTIVEDLQRWGRKILAKYDADDQAVAGVLLTTVFNVFQSADGTASTRGHMYGLIFSWYDGDDRTHQKCFRSVLKVNDANQVIQLIILDE